LDIWSSYWSKKNEEKQIEIRAELLRAIKRIKKAIEVKK